MIAPGISLRKLLDGVKTDPKTGVAVTETPPSPPKTASDAWKEEIALKKAIYSRMPDRMLDRDSSIKAVMEAAEKTQAERDAVSRNPTPDNVMRLHESVRDASKPIQEATTRNANYVKAPWPRVTGEAAKALGSTPLGKFVVFSSPGNLLEDIKNRLDQAAAFFRGVWYGIVGAPPEEDLRDEIAAVKGVGTAMMTGGAAGAGIAAATGLGAPAAAALGGVSLLGWALVDNFAGRLEMLQYQREEEKQRKRQEESLRDYLREKEETEIKIAEEKARIWEEAQKRIIEEKKKLYGETFPEAAEEGKSFYDKQLEEYERFLQEKKRLRQKYLEEEEEYWRRIEEERLKTQEEKRREEEEERRYNNVIYSLRDLLGRVKDYYNLAENAYYAKNPDKALENLDKAEEALKKMLELAESHGDILRKNGDYEWITLQSSALLDVIEAARKTWLGRNPAKEVADAGNKYADSTRHYHRKYNSVARNAARTLTTEPEDLKQLYDLLKHLRMQYATGLAIMDAARKVSDVYPLEEVGPSKLSYPTIVKLREWIRRRYKTPASIIPNSTWNRYSGTYYDSQMINAIYAALKDAGVALEEIAQLTLQELEAIATARQYVWAASQRGYWIPWELQKYRMLKDLLLLNDYQAMELFRLEIPPAEQEKTQIPSAMMADGGSMISDREWEIIKQQVKQLPITEEEKIATLKQLAKEYGRQITDQDIEDIKD